MLFIVPVVRQAKPGKGESDVDRRCGNLSTEPSGYPIPPGKVGDRRNRVLRELRGDPPREA
jgi:hypothetical protein